jgi:hypothetical protein
MNEPVLIEPITGKIYSLKGMVKSKGGNGSCFHKLPVWDSPIIIMDKSQVRFADNVVEESSKEKGSTNDMLY